MSFGYSSPVTNIDMCPRSRAYRCYRREREYPIIHVQMDHIAELGGVEISCSNLIPRLIPFGQQESDVKIKAGKSVWHRKQYQIVPANAITCHKAQGCTAINGVVVNLR